MKRITIVFGLCLLTPKLVLSQDTVVEANVTESGEVRTYIGNSPPSITPSPRYRPSTDPLSILRFSELRQELGLLDEQVSQLERLRTDVQSKTKDALAQLRTVDNRTEYLREMQDMLRSQVEAELEQCLLPHQQKRLRELQLQIEFHNNGMQSLSKGELGSILRLTNEQKQLLIIKQKEAMGEIEQEIQRLRQKLETEILEEVLTKEQNATLKESLGKRVSTIGVNSGDLR